MNANVVLLYGVIFSVALLAFLVIQMYNRNDFVELQTHKVYLTDLQQSKIFGEISILSQRTTSLVPLELTYDGKTSIDKMPPIPLGHTDYQLVLVGHSASDYGSWTINFSATRNATGPVVFSTPTPNITARNGTLVSWGIESISAFGEDADHLRIRVRGDVATIVQWRAKLEWVTSQV